MESTAPRVSTQPNGERHPSRRSAAGPVALVALLLGVLCPVLFVGLVVADPTLGGLGTAFLAALADLAAAIVAAVVATVLAAQRGARYVRTVVTGHPDGRAGRVAAHHAARWAVARERFSALQREYAAFEADPTAVAARPALTDVSVPATARFVEAYADAEYLATDTEPAGPRREEFAVAVDRAVAAWHEAGRVAEALAAVRHARTGHPGHPDRATGPTAPVGPRALGPARPAVPTAGPRWAPEYVEAASAVRRAAARGVRDLRQRLDA